MSDNAKYYWLAVNGASCAACPIPTTAAKIKCTPTPEVYVDFPTEQEQKETKQLMLKAPIEEVRRHNLWLGQRKDIVFLYQDNPEQPGKHTFWALFPD